MNDITIRPARHEDLARVASLAGELIRLHHGVDPRRFFLPERVEEGYAWWLGRELGRDEVVLLVAAQGEAIIGYAYARLEERDWNQLLDAHGALHDLWVCPEQRGRGVARRLVEASIAALVDRGAPRVVLHTAAGNPGATALFEKLGFRRTMIELTREAPVG